ncbi:DNA replication and repair protein RecF [Xanthomonas sacchari]|uniref:DNA replication and repair protein RecF n=1 Tax=Xanthomonas sacchari TaxID=56458 RepID=A0ABT3DY94_9XANT|nr:hypothetical protein [Xanthomonas sacchari]MCW0400485.1 DNA replication and repair protein RecF [Xanthomonas sacchari]MCW0421038.1 DNA replication and repair protein RecF [Xanthomonas sacchari]UYK72954.1 hypothetical protein NG828_00980 [Xanthomonas sacchari]
MQTIDLIPSLRSSFDSCELVGESIARCERTYNGRLRSVFFVSAASGVPEQAQVDEIQKTVVAPSYFASRDESRWNHYLVFVVPSSGTPDEAKRRAEIESDTSYAKKLVVPEAELGTFLRRGVDEHVQGASNANSLQLAWSEALQEAGLEAIDSDESRTSVIRAIRAGYRTSGNKTIRPVIDTQPLAFLRHLSIRQFGSRSLKGEFTFGRVNLIRGVNGAGKTSLLESIEHFLCGGLLRGKSVEKLDASATFTNNERVVIYQQRPTSYYQQRDLKWYGRKTNQRNRLYEAFARYNFLSADAAVEFSRDEEQRDLTTGLSRVALGPEAGFTWDRIQQVQGDIGPQLGSLQKEITALESQLGRVGARLSTLSLPAPELSSRSTHISLLLEKLGIHVDAQTLTTSAGLQHMAGIRLFLDSAPEDLAPTIDAVQAQAKDLEGMLDRIRELEARQRANVTRLAEIDGALKSADSLRRCVDRLSSYVRVKYAESLARLADIDRAEEPTLPTHESLLLIQSEVEKVQPVQGIEESISSFYEKVKEDVSRLRLALEETGAAFEAALSRTEERRVLTAQLRTTALQLVRAHPDDCCPLCRTSMGVENLLKRIDEVVVDVDSAQIAAMEGARSKLLADLSVSLERQGLVASLIEGFPRIANDSLSAVLKMVYASEEEKARRSAGRNALLGGIRDLQAQGFSQQEYLGLLLRFESDVVPHLDASRLGLEQIDQATAYAESRYTTALLDRAKCASEGEAILQQIVEVSIRLGCGSDVSAAKFKAAQGAASRRKFMNALSDLPSDVQARANGGLREFVDLAQMALAQVSSLSDDLRDSGARNLEAVALNQESTTLRSALSKLMRERDNLKSANDALSKLIREHSLERGLNEFLSSNLQAIQSIFQKIHAPNELRLSNLSACELIRNSDGSSASLTQISTGQRAALVLSVFITLNMSLRSGPPMMLVDDPVAHVDDMNSLALLDYLADIAETGRRQIFFATADEKLANLFEKKMGFMGSEFTVTALTRESAGAEWIH